MEKVETMYKLINDEIGPLLLNMEDQTFQRLPDTANKFFRGGRMFNYFESLSDFMQSQCSDAVVPFWAVSFTEKGRRYSIKILIGGDEYTFWNVEKIGSEWIENKIVGCDAEKPYFGYFIRNPGAQNDCLVGSVMEIKKAG